MNGNPFITRKRRGRPKTAAFGRGIKSQFNKALRAREKKLPLPKNLPECNWKEELNRYDEYLKAGYRKEDAIDTVAGEIASRRWFEVLGRFDAARQAGTGYEDALVEVGAQMAVTPERLRAVLQDRARAQRLFPEAYEDVRGYIDADC
jgi:hypothetical protein